MEATHVENFKGYEIQIISDCDCVNNPLEWDNLGTIIYKHNSYELGHEVMAQAGQYGSIEHDLYAYIQNKFNVVQDKEGYQLDFDDCTDIQIKKIQKWVDKNFFYLPVYLYNHSILHMNTEGFSCPWDSGQVGWIYITRDKILKEYGVKKITKNLKGKVLDILNNEIKTMDDYVSGNVYGYEIYKQGDLIDSCWGFFGDYDSYVLQEAKSIVNVTIKQEKKRHFEKLKMWIKNQVPFQYRKACLI